MDLSNVRALMEATAASPHASALAYVELSNEVVPNTISAAQWVADADSIRNMSAQIFGAKGLAPPQVVGPDQGGSAIADVVAALDGREGLIHAAVYHQYPECVAPAKGEPVVMQPSCLSQLPSAAAGYSATAAAVPGLAVWSGEGADHSGGGVANLTDTFRSSFYYAIELASLPTVGVELMARQCLNGGDYELLQRNSFVPNPDYYLLWLFKQLVKQGARALNATLSAPALQSGLFVYAFDAKAGASVALLAVNAHASNTYRVSLAGPAVGGARTEFHLTGDVAVPHGPVAVNGRVLAGDLPPVASLGVPGEAGSVLEVAPASIVFVTL